MPEHESKVEGVGIKEHKTVDTMLHQNKFIKNQKKEKILLDKPNIIYYNIKRTVQNRDILGS